MSQVGASAWKASMRSWREAQGQAIGTQALACRRGVIITALLQCLGCSVNAAFLTEGVTAE